MSERIGFRIDMEAAKALVDWKSRFEVEVASRAQQLAAESAQPDFITLAHYRQAAQLAPRSLSAAIQEGGSWNDDHQAA